MPRSRLETFRGAGHFPHPIDPERLLGILYDFLADHARIVVLGGLA